MGTAIATGVVVSVVLLDLALAGIGVYEIAAQRRVLPRLGGSRMSPTRCGVSAIGCSIISLSFMLIVWADSWGVIVPLALCAVFAVVDLVLARRSRRGREAG